VDLLLSRERREKTNDAPLNVLIVCVSAIYSRSLRCLLADEGRAFCPQTLHDADDPLRPDRLLVAPQSWEEIGFWLPLLRNRFSDRGWVILADPRITGTFLSALQGLACRERSPLDAPEQLSASLIESGDPESASISATLLARFEQGIPRLMGRRPAAPITARELQCGCAVSLGLSNRQIGELVHLTVATVKSHLHTLMEKLGLADRKTLGELFGEVLLPLTPPPRRNEIQPKRLK
jgi:DNA-binding CsgD family transcriptional regulator